MKNTLSVVVAAYIAMSSGAAFAVSDDQILLNSFHQYGITKCDKVILKESGLQSDWSFFISKHTSAIDDSVKEASVSQVFGTKDDTVKTDVSYIQSKKACFYHVRNTVTFAGPCKEHIDMNAWYVSTAMNSKDYTEYKNKGGVTMLAKEISVGNFQACIQETSRRDFVLY